ncbi:MAG: glycosyltransferase family 4 protein [Alphaproteobacteria bacterium]|nr:glycosyltransferase family 4 protein [Alphaproteobacteria bacterium]
METPLPPLGISWVLATISGYGIYGIQILLQYLRRGGGPKNCILTSTPSVAVLPPLAQAKLDPIFATATKIHGYLKENPTEILSFKHPMLHGCSSDFSGFAGQDRVWGAPNVACAAIEHLVCTDHGRKISKNYDMFIAISRWNADYLKSLDVGPVHLCFQGIDPALFYPGPSSGLYRDRFVIFSGGKFEYRKGQDIVLAAFKRFREKYPDALLVTCWQNLLAPDVQAFSLAGHIDGVPDMAAEYGLQMTPWLLKQGLPPGSFVDLPFTHNLLMPSVLRDCDMAVFPNRCEGGTNLVAMEAMACGVPTYVSYNTGQKDLADLIGCDAFRAQGPVKQSVAMQTIADWGETNVDEVVAAMEHVYSDRAAARAKAARVAAKVAAEWNWGGLNEKLLQVVCDRKSEA